MTNPNENHAHQISGLKSWFRKSFFLEFGPKSESNLNSLGKSTVHFLAIWLLIHPFLLFHLQLSDYSIVLSTLCITGVKPFTSVI